MPAACVTPDRQADRPAGGGQAEQVGSKLAASESSDGDPSRGPRRDGAGPQP